MEPVEKIGFWLRCLSVLKSTAVRNALGTVLAAFGVEFGLGIDDTTATLLISVTVSALLNKFIDKKIQPVHEATVTLKPGWNATDEAKI